MSRFFTGFLFQTILETTRKLLELESSIDFKKKKSQHNQYCFERVILGTKVSIHPVYCGYQGITTFTNNMTPQNRINHNNLL